MPEPKHWNNNPMALLQISEPGGAPDPHQRRIAVGIDLGTTHSLVAAVRHGVAECLPDETGHVILPSAVRYLAGGKRQIGASALAEAEIASEIYSIAGNYDILAKFYVEKDRDIGHFVGEKVQPIPGIVDTRTIITFKAF